MCMPLLLNKSIDEMTGGNMKLYQIIVCGIQRGLQQAGEMVQQKEVQSPVAGDE